VVGNSVLASSGNEREQVLELSARQISGSLHTLAPRGFARSAAELKIEILYELNGYLYRNFIIFLLYDNFMFFRVNYFKISVLLLKI